ncbi:MAG: hypothetical protein HFJ60_04730 [Clostridia bacterium]|jgi:hypothetical protein|nr:hypothetical protein [Clostridia bacterium]
MRYRELAEVLKNERGHCWVDLGTNKGLKMIFEIVKKTFGKISIEQAVKIVSKLSDSELEYLSENEMVSIITNPHEMAEKLKLYDAKYEEPPTKAHWKAERSYDTRKTIKIIYGDCNFTRILKKFKYIDIYNMTLDSEETIEECDFDINEILVVFVTEPSYCSSSSKNYMYIYLPLSCIVYN